MIEASTSTAARAISKFAAKQPGQSALIASALMLIVATSWLSPLLTSGGLSRAVRSDIRFQAAADGLALRIHNIGQVERDSLVLSVTPLVDAEVTLLARGDSAGIVAGPERIKPVLRIDRLILGVGFLLVTLLSATTLSRAISVGSGEKPDIREKPDINTVGEGRDRSSHTVLAFLEHDVDRAEDRADSMFQRSTYLLVAGILMAFVGVTIFAFTLPSPGATEELTNYLARAVRPAGVLLFIEAIAWFLLRQYRSLVEDYKSFYRTFLRRSNYLLATKVLDRDQPRAEDLLLVSALLNEDLSGRLTQGQTTEGIEVLKTDEPTPINQLVAALIRRHDGATGSPP